MDLLLWRWSTAVQLTSLVMLALFFWVLGRSSKRAEVRWWVLAWLANLAALTVTTVYWYLGLDRFVSLVGGVYVSAKLTFILLLVQGAWALARPGEELLSRRTLITTPLAYGFLGALFLHSIPTIGVVQHLVMGLILTGSGLLLLHGRPSALWLGAGLGLRGVLALTESAAYWVQLDATLDLSPAFRELVTYFLAATSSFDAGAEWFIALGCVLAIAERSQRELAEINQHLTLAQDYLRRLADRDPLTALDNRRCLPELFRNVQPDGATFLFFDLDGFKQINDLHGHAVGDQCLARFAEAVRESFRPTDAVVRYGGDEFLVVAGGLDRMSALDRVEALRSRLASEPTPEPRIRFSFGVADLRPGGSPEAALQAADSEMYAAKRRR